MRLALIVVVALALIGCSREGPSQPIKTMPAPVVPTSPGPIDPPAAPPQLTFLWVVVIEEAGVGACIPGVTVEIVSGQGLGSRIKQNDVCSYWDPDYQAMFHRLHAGEEVTLRASASGFLAKEITVVPTTGSQTAVTIELARMR